MTRLIQGRIIFGGKKTQREKTEGFTMMRDMKNSKKKFLMIIFSISKELISFSRNPLILRHRKEKIWLFRRAALESEKNPILITNQNIRICFSFSGYVSSPFF